MAGSLNKVLLIGRVASDPKLKISPKGVPSMTFSFATNKTWRTPDGEKKTKASFHFIRIYGKKAEALEKYLIKGKEVYLEGEIEYEEWADGEKKKAVTVISAYEVQLIGGVPATGSEGRRETRSNPDPGPVAGAGEYDDGIPF